MRSQHTLLRCTGLTTANYTNTGHVITGQDHLITGQDHVITGQDHVITGQELKKGLK